MVKYTCLYYSLIQSRLEFSGEGRGRALGVGKFLTLSSRGHGTGELGLCCSPRRPVRPPALPRADRPAGAAAGGTRPRPGPRDRARREGKGWKRKGKKKKKEGAGGDDLPVPSPLAGAPVRNSISIFYEK